MEPTWVKYLQLRLLSHWGVESVCAINDLRVNGKSAAGLSELGVKALFSKG